MGENNEAALYLVNEIFSKTNIPLIIAGRKPSKELENTISNYKNIELKANIPTKEIDELIKEAQINVLPTFQATGIKLKLLAVLFNGKHCVVNDPMVANTGLETLCAVKNSADEMMNEINKLFSMPFDIAQKEQRRKILMHNFSNSNNIEKLIALI